MTDEFKIDEANNRNNEKKRMNQDSAQSAVFHYKEERRKQLAGQFANLTGSHDTSSSSVHTNSKNNCFKSYDLSKTESCENNRGRKQENHKNTNKFCDNNKQINDNQNTKDSCYSHSTVSLKNGKDKSSKRKSHLNRSLNVESMPNDEDISQKLDLQSCTFSMLPFDNVLNFTPVSLETSTSSQKVNPSLYHIKNAVNVDFVNNDSSSLKNGFAHNATGNIKNFVNAIVSNDDDKEVFDNSEYSKSEISLSIPPSSNNFKNSQDEKSINSPLKQVQNFCFKNCSNENTNGVVNNNNAFVAPLYDENSSLHPEKCTYVQLKQTTTESNEAANKNENLPSDLYYISKISCTDTVDYLKTMPKSQSECNLTVLSKNDKVYSPLSSPNSSLEIIEEDNSTKPSILKKKFEIRSLSFDIAKPNSILKRKKSEDFNTNSFSFSSPYKQGILKKHNSLDEDQIRRRSCSPDVESFRFQEFKPILKIQRRSSLEELMQSHSPELHSILKRSKPSNIENSNKIGNPQGILKRQIFSAGSFPLSKSFDQMNIELLLKEISSENDTNIKPILKNKRNSFDYLTPEKLISKPILKKKFISEFDFDEEKPKKPILKSNSCKFLKEDFEKFSVTEVSNELNYTDSQIAKLKSIKPILKKKDSRDVKSDDDTINYSYNNDNREKRLSLPESNVSCYQTLWNKDRPLSVAERVLTLENFLVNNNTGINAENRESKNCISHFDKPFKNSRFLRNSSRYKTQPITHEEITNTKSILHEKNQFLNQVHIPEMKSRKENNFRSHSFANIFENKSVACQNENSSDTKTENKFKSGESEVLSQLRRSNSVIMKANLFSKLEKENQKAAEESKVKKNSDIHTGRRRFKIKCSDLSSRFSTQPVTSEEVAEAKKQNFESRKKIPSHASENNEERKEPSFLPISERIKIFSPKVDQKNCNNIKFLRRSPGVSRFKTQPITVDEVQIAKKNIDNSAVKNFQNVPDDKKKLVKSNSEIFQNNIRPPIPINANCRSYENVPWNNKRIFKCSSQIFDRNFRSPASLSINQINTGSHEDLSYKNNKIFKCNSEIFSKDFRPSILSLDQTTAQSNENLSNKNTRLLKCNSAIFGLGSCTSETSFNDQNIKSSESKNSDIFKQKFRPSVPTSASCIYSNPTKNNVCNENKIVKCSSEIFKPELRPRAFISADLTSSKKLLNHRSKNENSAVHFTPKFVKYERKFKNKEGIANEMNVESVVPASSDVVDECSRINKNSSIAQRLAALQKSGQLDWKKRISRIAPENEMTSVININETQELLKKELTNGFRGLKVAESEKPTEEKKDKLLADRLEKLENASQSWKKRVESSDAAQFSVAGKMASSLTAVPQLLPSLSPIADRKKKSPYPSRFKSFRETKKEVHSDPTSPGKPNFCPYARSNSLPFEETNIEKDDRNTTKLEKASLIVNVPQIFDENFSTFFGNVDYLSNTPDLENQNTDLSNIKIETERLPSTYKKAKAQRKHAASGNPLKNLANRIEIKNEYYEIKTNVAERQLKEQNIEKLSKTSSFAVEVLAGLASKEDFSAVHLKKSGISIPSSMLPYKSLMLLHVKGRRHVQTRLVQPVVESINSGDSYILVTSTKLYHWIGQFCNVIEKSRGAEIAQHILTAHDLGCTSATNVITVIEDTSKPNVKLMQNFWIALGVKSEEAAFIKAVNSGHPDEDEIYENSLISTNMIYEAIDDELIPVEKYWGAIPKIELLDPNKVFVFDFGSELYVWMGKNIELKKRKSSIRLAKELWDSGYNYKDCDICPITSVFTIGNRNVDVNKNVISGTERPDWCLFAKVTQHMETVLFREKFLDWPDFSRVIRAKGKDEDTEKQIDTNYKLNPYDVTELLKQSPPASDLVLEGNHLGRGIQFFDEERKKYCLINTVNVCVWHIKEFESEEVPKKSLGQFYSTDSYIVRWLYSISYTGRELSGQPSKHTVIGRDRCVYFYWQGKNASLNEQGAAALLTVELDKEKGIQFRICQGFEPPAFYNIFDGRTIIYKKRRIENNAKSCRLFICRGEIKSEAALIEVSCNIRQLRSRASLVLINVNSGVTYIWHGCKVTKEASAVCVACIHSMKMNTPNELGLRTNVTLEVHEIVEGSEPREFFNDLGSNNRKLYASLLEDKENYNSTPLLYSLSSNSGIFTALPVWPLCIHIDIVSAYPFLQEDLYAANQPALFLLDTGKELWLWQGWWPERENTVENDTNTMFDEVNQNADNFRGSATVRWQAERRAAMQTALDYWKSKYSSNQTKAYLVWAGLEPLEFTNLFPDWTDRDDVAEINIMDGRKSGEVLNVEQELARLIQSTYPIEQLLQKPLPDGVDPTKLEMYLSPLHFQDLFKVTKEEFITLPSWKQTNLKKNVGLF